MTDSSPGHLWDDAAIKSMFKWRFKASTEARRRTQEFVFKVGPYWLTPDVLKAQSDIGLVQDQEQRFTEIVGKFVDDLAAVMQTEVRRGTTAGALEQEIHLHRARLEKDMDTRLKSLLTPEQWGPYEVYKGVLKKALTADSLSVRAPPTRLRPLSL